MMKDNNVIGLGTAAIGRPQYINIKENVGELSLDEFKQQGLAVLDKAYSLGIRYFDTAPGYGMAEQLLIDWLQERKFNDVEVATKWGYTYVANFVKDAKIHEVKDHSFIKLNEQWLVSQKFGKSLKLYQIHSAGFDTEVLTDKSVHERLFEIKQTSNALIGITSSGSEQVKTIEKALLIKVNREDLFDAFQITYNVFDQSLLDIIDELKTKGKTVIIKEALANGRVFPNVGYPKYRQVYSYLEALAVKYEVGIDAVAIRFVIDSINPTKVLSGASTCEQLIENLKANTFKLTSKEVESLKKLSVSPQSYWAERKELEWR